MPPPTAATKTDDTDMLVPGGTNANGGSTLAERSVMYGLLALHQMANYVTRLAIPFLIPCPGPVGGV